MTHSILKMAGSQSTRLKSVHDAIAYIIDKRKTSSSLMGEQYLSLTDPEEAWDILEKGTTSKTRLFHHVILSPGNCNNPEKMYDVLEKMKILWHNYPLIFAVHQDKPNHIHGHILIHPVNVFNNRRYQISPKQFKSLLAQVNDILLKDNLPELSQIIRSRNTETSASLVANGQQDMHDVSEKENMEVPKDIYLPPIPSYSPQPVWQVQDTVFTSHRSPSPAQLQLKQKQQQDLISIFLGIDPISRTTCTKVTNGVLNTKRKVAIPHD